MSEAYTLHHGDCLEVMRGMEDASVDSIVTDPPYLLGFMGKAWDAADGVAGRPDVWREALRVLKPGGHMLCFGGSRTFHRVAVAIEDAGFEIRDTIMWIYGSGFPKSLDVSKAIDKAKGLTREETRPGIVKRDGYGDDWDTGSSSTRPRRDTPASPEAAQWSGWGSALKPAHEPIILARKPLDGTIANNVLTHGVGALNVDGCRVGTEERVNSSRGTPGAGRMRKCNQVDRGDGKTPDGRDLANVIAYAERSKQREPVTVTGRFPANVIHDGSPEVLDAFAAFGESRSVSGGRAGTKSSGGLLHNTGEPRTDYRGGYTDAGSPARFFYCAKASRSERGEGNAHPTVKPLKLMRYLARLITPKGGVVLDPFLGSGTTGVAAMIEGHRFIGIEREESYIDIARRRIEAAYQQREIQLRFED